MIPTLFVSFIIVLVDANQHFEFGIISHQTQWHMHCPQNYTPIIVRPPFNDRSLTRYQCPSSSASQLMHIVSIEVDFTFLCRSSSRLLWIIVDLYQYNAWLTAFQPHEMIISVRLNGQMSLNDSKNDINHYQNRSVLINAFYIPFESMDRLRSQPIEIQVDIQHTNRSTRCSFILQDDLTWTTFIEDYCHTDQSRTLLVPLARCDFFPRVQARDTPTALDVEVIDEQPTVIPDFNVVLSIDEDRLASATSSPTTIVTSFKPEDPRTIPADYYLLFDEYSRKLSFIVTMLTNSSHLIVLILIFTITLLILIVIFFLYILCYHYHFRSNRQPRLSI